MVLDSKMFSLGGGTSAPAPGGNLTSTAGQEDGGAGGGGDKSQLLMMLAAALGSMGEAIADPNKTVAGELNNLMMQAVKASQFQELLGGLMGEGGGMGAGSDKVGKETAEALSGGGSIFDKFNLGGGAGEQLQFGQAGDFSLTDSKMSQGQRFSQMLFGDVGSFSLPKTKSSTSGALDMFERRGI